MLFGLLLTAGRIDMEYFECKHFPRYSCFISDWDHMTGFLEKISFLQRKAHFPTVYTRCHEPPAKSTKFYQLYTHLTAPNSIFSTADSPLGVYTWTVGPFPFLL